MDSGWNCTPRTSYLRCASAIICPLPSLAVTFRHDGKSSSETTNGELTAKAVENRVLPDYLNRGCHPVIHMREIFQMRPETFANRLMTQAYSENALMWGITTQKFGKYSRFAWQARPRLYDHTLVRSGLFDAYTVVAAHISIVTQ